MDILIAINENYFEPCRTMLYSLFYHNKEKITIHLLHKSLDQRYIEKLSKYVDELGGMLSPYLVEEPAFDDIMLGKDSLQGGLDRLSIEMYYRIIAYRILPEEIDRVLWLDSDIIIRSDLHDFYWQSFDGNYLIGCADGNELPIIEKVKRNMDLPEECRYFNSGVLLFNLKKIREDGLDSYIFQTIHDYKDRLIYPDQDLLNKIYCSKVKYADGRIYNNNVGFSDSHKEYIPSASILHYLGPAKPWNAIFPGHYFSYYWDERRKMGDRIGYLKFIIPCRMLDPLRFLHHAFRKIKTSHRAAEK